MAPVASSAPPLEKAPTKTAPVHNGTQKRCETKPVRPAPTATTTSAAPAGPKRRAFETMKLSQIKVTATTTSARLPGPAGEHINYANVRVKAEPADSPPRARSGSRGRHSSRIKKERRSRSHSRGRRVKRERSGSRGRRMKREPGRGDRGRRNRSRSADRRGEDRHRDRDRDRKRGLRSEEQHRVKGNRDNPLNVDGGKGLETYTRLRNGRVLCHCCMSEVPWANFNAHLEGNKHKARFKEKKKAQQPRWQPKLDGKALARRLEQRRIEREHFKRTMSPLRDESSDETDDEFNEWYTNVVKEKRPQPPDPHYEEELPGQDGFTCLGRRANKTWFRSHVVPVALPGFLPCPELAVPVDVSGRKPFERRPGAGALGDPEPEWCLPCVFPSGAVTSAYIDPREPPVGIKYTWRDYTQRISKKEARKMMVR